MQQTETNATVEPRPIPRRRGPVRLYRVGDVALFLVWIVSAASSGSMAWNSLGDSAPLKAAHFGMVGVVYVINGFLFLLRGPARSRRIDPVSMLIAAGGSWLVIPLSRLSLTWDPDWLLITSTLGLIVAYVFVVWGLLTLRRNFSILPEARQLVRHGPYRLVRHPLYAAYIVTYLLICLPRIGPLALVLAGTGIVCEVLRARNEEAALAEVFPEYATYAAATPRFVPFLRNM